MEAELATFQDAVEHALDAFGLNRGAKTERNARRAVLEAYRDLPSRNPLWTIWRRQLQIVTVASYSTGTITYDHSGGASERLLTLASGTLPTWAAFGSIKINEDHFQLSARLSATTAQLSTNSNPGEDVAAGTSYTLYRDTYPLPVDFQSAEQFMDAGQFRDLEMVSPGVAMECTRHWSAPGDPLKYAFISPPEYYGGLAVVFSPPPSAARVFEAAYSGRPRPLRVEDYSTGTVTVASGTTALSGSGTTFLAKHAGAVIRFGDATYKPTSLSGGLDGDHPYVEQRTIDTFTDGTNLVLDAAVSQAFTAVKYTISDPIDLEAGAMLNAFWRGVEYFMAVLENTKDVAEREARYERALKQAMAADYRASAAPRGVPDYASWSMADREVYE